MHLCIVKEEDAHPITVILKQFLKKNRLGDRVSETDLSNRWEEVVGKVIANHTQAVRLRGSTVYIHLDSAALREELVYHQTELVKRINEFLGSTRVKEVVLV